MKELPKIANDDGKKVVQLPFTKFTCIGASQPHDHPHVFLEMGSKQKITCPYCGTKYKFVDAIDYLSDLKD